MGFMGLLPESGEPDRDYHYRVARTVGVQLDNEGVKEFQLTNAIADLLLDVQYTSTFAFQAKLRKMWWGRGYAPEIQSLYMIDGKEISAARKATRLNLLTNNFHRL